MASVYSFSKKDSKEAKKEQKAVAYRSRWWILFGLITFLILALNFVPGEFTTEMNSTHPGGNVLAAEDTLLGSSRLTQTATDFKETIGRVDVVDAKSYLGLFIFVALVYSVLWRYIVWHNKNNPRKANIMVIGIVLNALLLIARMLTIITIDVNWQVDYMFGLLVPVAAFSMLLAALVNRSVATFATAVAGLFLTILCEGNLLFVVAGVIGGLVGISQVSRMDQRGKYVTAAAYISGVYVIMVLAWGFMWNLHYSLIGIGIILGLINGVLSVIFAIGCMPFFESAFKITTVVKLLELSNFNHPLLKRLMMEAPGTYQHSVLVGNLAETAAVAVGADSLLVRVASYFHDIGKVKRPDFFIENIRSGENPHDKLQPNMSVLIITSHPKEGVEMARDYKLPKEITDIIVQHHGTGLVSMFYQKALQNATGTQSETIKENDFRYPGPKPQTKEAAIVMLADSVQAAVQAMKGATNGQIEGRIREVIRSKFNDNQLAECDLTFKDLDTIAVAFTRVLAGVNHQRLNYPKAVEQELARRAKEEKLAAEQANAKPAESTTVVKVENKAENKSESTTEKTEKGAEQSDTVNQK